MRVAGADVWKGRWVVVALDGGRFGGVFLATTFEAALATVPDAAVVAVDVPIGLPATGARRDADAQARAFVGPRRHSVFFTPATDLLEAASLGEANGRARARGGPGVSAQAFALRAHILQVAPVAERDGRVHEAHPEVSFVAANGGRHLAWPKTSWNGFRLRRRILAEQGVALPDDLGAAGQAGVADVLDAAAVAWTADRIAAGRAERFPPGHRRIGAIWR